MASSVTSTPNILFINCHDLGQHLGCYGIETVATPRLDGLADEGVRFANSFCVAPQCSPSRAAMFTGRYPHSNGVMGLTHRLFRWDLHPGEKHLAALLGDAGYSTALVGHQHETRWPEKHGWATVELGEDDDVAPMAIAKMRTLAKEARPFYLQVGFHRPHRHDTPSGYRSQADSSLGVTVPPYIVDEPSAREDLAGFQGDIQALDANVGRILDELDALRLRENTWVIFTTDHGIPYPRAKCSVYDPGLVTALLMRWPRGFAGRRVAEAMISNVDYVQTILEMIGLAAPANCQGKSFAALLRGDPSYAPRTEMFGEMTYHQYYDPRRCVRTATHKLIVNFSAAPFFMDPSQQWRPKCCTTQPGDPSQCFHDPVELYDLRADPLEMTNLAGKPDMAKVQRELTERLRSWMACTSDPLLTGAVSSPMHDIATAILEGREIPA